MEDLNIELTEKQEAFAQGVASGKTQADAYRDSYSADNMKPSSLYVEASTLMSNPKISRRVKQLQEQNSLRNQITVDTLLAELEENRQAALTAETPQAGAATTATMGKAKLLGLDKQVVDHISSDGSMATRPTRIELVAPKAD